MPPQIHDGLTENLAPGQRNMTDTEGLISVVAGSGLLLYGIRGWRSLPFALLGGALAYRGVTRHCAFYEATGIDRSDGSGERSAVVTIQRPPEEVYQFCSDMRNFPQFISFLQAVWSAEGNRCRWSVQVPGGRRHEWTVELLEPSEPRAVRWRSLDDAPIRLEGSLEFEPAPAGRGTRVRATVHFLRGRSRRWLAGVVQPFAKHKLRHDLRQLKQIMEAGEVITVKGQSSGRAQNPSRASWIDDTPRTQPTPGHQREERVESAHT